MKFIYVATKGAVDPTLASIPLHLAVNGSLEVGHDTAVILVGDGAEIAVGGTAETLQGVGVPPMSELVAKLKEHEVPVYVWKACAVARGATDESLETVAGSWVTPPEVAKLFEGADKTLVF